MSRFILMAFTDNPDLASVLDAAGVDRIGVDLEVMGKVERQAGASLRLSGHDARSLAALAPRLKTARLLARINPLHDGSAAEIETVLSYGAQVLIVPYFRTADEPFRIAAMVRDRALVLPLVETLSALSTIDALASGFGELYFGLNDLRLSLHYPSFLPVFDYPPFNAAVAQARALGIRSLIAGVGRPDDDQLPIAPQLVYDQLRRLDAGGSLLSRVFVRPRQDWHRIADDVRALRAVLTESGSETRSPERPTAAN
jgi:citrate lyase beta subunit